MRFCASVVKWSSQRYGTHLTRKSKPPTALLLREPLCSCDADRTSDQVCAADYQQRPRRSHGTQRSIVAKNEITAVQARHAEVLVVVVASRLAARGSREQRPVLTQHFRHARTFSFVFCCLLSAPVSPLLKTEGSPLHGIHILFQDGMSVDRGEARTTCRVAFDSASSSAHASAMPRYVLLFLPPFLTVATTASPLPSHRRPCLKLRRATNADRSSNSRPYFCALQRSLLCLLDVRVVFSRTIDDAIDVIISEHLAV